LRGNPKDLGVLISEGSLLSGSRQAASLIVRVTAGIQEVIVEDAVFEDELGVVELVEDVFQSFLFPIFVQVNFVVFPLTFVVLTAPILVQALPEVAANVMEFKIEKIRRAVSEILEIFNMAKQ